MHPIMVPFTRFGQRSVALAHEDGKHSSEIDWKRVHETAALLLRPPEKIRLRQQQVAESLGLPVWTLGQYCLSNTRPSQRSALLAFLLHTHEELWFSSRSGAGTGVNHTTESPLRSPYAPPNRMQYTFRGENEGAYRNEPLKLRRAATHVEQGETGRREGRCSFPTEKKYSTGYEIRSLAKSGCKGAPTPLPSSARAEANASVTLATPVGSIPKATVPVAQTLTSGRAAADRESATVYCPRAAGDYENRAAGAAVAHTAGLQREIREIDEGLSETNTGATKSRQQMSRDCQVPTAAEERNLLLDLLRQTLVINHQPLQVAVPSKARCCCRRSTTTATQWQRYKSNRSSPKVPQATCSTSESATRETSFNQRETGGDTSTATAEEFGSSSWWKAANESSSTGVSRISRSGSSSERLDSGSGSNSFSVERTSTGSTCSQESRFQRSPRNRAAPDSLTRNTTALVSPTGSTIGVAKLHTPEARSCVEKKMQVTRTCSSNSMQNQLLRRWTWRIRKSTASPRYLFENFISTYSCMFLTDVRTYVYICKSSTCPISTNHLVHVHRHG